VTTPAAAHGGCCPPLVTAVAQRLAVTLEPSYGGARIEVDGHPRGAVEPPEPASFEIGMRPEAASLVTLAGAEPLLAGLRRRRILIDGPRILARDDREAARERAGGGDTAARADVVAQAEIAAERDVATDPGRPV
jgi:hypothetical protein